MEGWAKYGFPDPHLATPYYPYVGLIKALNERRALIGKSQYNIPEFFRLYYSRPEILFNELDNYIMDTGYSFINPARFDMLTDSSNFADMYYTKNDLLLLGAEGDAEKIITTNRPGFTHLLPDWSAEWAIQRYRIINGMRYRRISSGVLPVNYSFIRGHGRTAEDAYNSFIAQYPGETFSPGVTESYTYEYYEFDYVFEAQYFDRLETDFPYDSWLVFYAKPIFWIDTFYSFGSGIIPGWNLVKADSNGVFLRQEFPPPRGSHGWQPTKSGSSSHLIDNGYLFYADFNDTFNFKEVSA